MSDLICSDCGHLGEPRMHTRGYLLIEIVLWCCLIIPGLVYSIWRHNSRVDVCRKCGSEHVIPLDSPRGLRLANDFHPNLPPQILQPSSAAVGAGRVLGRAVAGLFKRR